MTYYLIDYENVRVQGLDGIGKLSEEDKICIFYSENADSLSFGLHRRLNATKAEILYRKVDAGGKNALDFQLSSWLGYTICENKENSEVSYCLVTKDKGFSHLVQFWKKRNIPIRMSENCTEPNPVVVAEEKKSDKQSAKNEKKVKVKKKKKQSKIEKKEQQAYKEKLIKAILPHVKDKKIAEHAAVQTLDVIKKCDGMEKSKVKQQVNNTLIGVIGDSQDAGKIYQAIKSLI